RRTGILGARPSAARLPRNPPTAKPDHSRAARVPIQSELWIGRAPLQGSRTFADAPIAYEYGYENRNAPIPIAPSSAPRSRTKSRPGFAHGTACPIGLYSRAGRRGVPRAKSPNTWWL